MGSAVPFRDIDGIVDAPNSCFIVDTTPSPSYWDAFLYDRISGVAFGEEENELSATQDLRLCFNCASPNHTVASCPEPINRQLVALSRQLFNFLHPDPGGQAFTRFYVAEGWRQQRLEWLSSYAPGMICGPLLRDALGLQEGDSGNTVEWLRNIAYWGYPPGWVGCRDPIALVCHRILQSEAEGQVADSFTIFKGSDDDEEIDLSSFSLQGPSVTAAATPIDEEQARWATYPNTYFSSTTLSIYNGIPPDTLSTRVSVTFTPERRALWERILSGGLATSNSLSVPPWRMPGAFDASRCLALESVIEDLDPPPPLTTPPPLPFTPSSPVHMSAANRQSMEYFGYGNTVNVGDDKSVVDMDVSD